VRKVTGFHEPSRANEVAFERAIVRITEATDELMDELVLRGQPLKMTVE
jgi:hypothetical protein